MLAITQNAIEAIKQVTPDDAGLRVFLGENDTDLQSLRVEITTEPHEDDQVLETDGAQVFLEPQAAAALDEMTLDAAADEGRVRFAVVPQR